MYIKVCAVVFAVSVAKAGLPYSEYSLWLLRSVSLSRSPGRELPNEALESEWSNPEILNLSPPQAFSSWSRGPDVNLVLGTAARSYICVTSCN